MNSFVRLLLALVWNTWEAPVKCSFLLYLLIEILQLVHKISSFPEALYKWGVLNKFSEFTDKHKKQSSASVLSKDVLKEIAKLTEKHLCRSLFLNKVAGCKLEIVRSSHWRRSLKNVFLKTSQISQEKNCVGVSLYKF